MTPASPSVADLRKRAFQLDIKIPASILEKDDLIEFVQSAELRSTAAPKLNASRSVADLKGRLKELCLEIPSNIVEKSELVALVDEAEKESRNCVSRPASAKPRRIPEDPPIPKPWYKKESRSYPGRFYYVNGETGETDWNAPKLVEVVDAQSADASKDKSAGEYKKPLISTAQLSKHDYRDDVFIQTGSVVDSFSAGRAWSRSNAMSCNLGPCGVKSLTMCPFAEKAEERPEVLGWSSSSAYRPNILRGEKISWIKGDLIGHGALGRVFKALNQSSGEMFAVKEVAIDTRDQNDAAYMDSINNEVNIMKELDHPNIVALLGFDYIDSYFYIYMEHMSGGSITQALQQFGAFDESLVASYAKQLLSGLSYLHAQSPPVIHRDIKGPNILIGEDCIVKLADFGCSKKSDTSVTHTMRGSIPWMAPEVLTHSRHGRAADIWSFGCVIIEMCTATAPWGHFENQMAAVFRIGLSEDIPPLPENASVTCREFILCCLKRKHEERCNAPTLLEKDFLQPS